MNTTDNKQENEAVNGFVFYRSYYNAIKTLSKKNRLIAYEALVEYALNREETTGLPVAVYRILTMAIPNLDANRRKYLKKIERAIQKNIEDAPMLFEELSKKEDEKTANNNSANGVNKFHGGDDDDFID